MSKVINLKVSFLVQGLFPLEAFDIDGFNLQTRVINEEMVSNILKDNPFYAPMSLIPAAFQEHGAKESKFLCLINENYILEINNKQNALDRKQITEYIQENLESIRGYLEKELKLITNIDINLPIAVAKAINIDEFGPVSVTLVNNNNSNINISQYTENLKNLLSRRLSRRISIKSLEELGLKNSRFQRALEFYYSSFIPFNRSIRFVLLFSSLEALFNLESKNVTASVASSTSKILFVDEKKERKISYKIRDYYDRRSYYIHGNQPKEVTEEQEFDLREIVRKVILIYWQIASTQNLADPKQIVEFLNENKQKDLTLTLQLFIKHLEDEDYKDLYNEMMEMLPNNE